MDTQDPDSTEYQLLLDECMEWDLTQIAEWADCIVLLPGWLGSKGCEGELLEAERCGKAAYEYDPEGRIQFRYGTGAVVLAPTANNATLITRPKQDDTDMDDVFTWSEPAQVRTFDSGATRDTEEGKLDFVGFLSPWVLECFAKYMYECRYQTDGTLRSSSNWRKGIPKDVYLSSMARHFMNVWKGAQANEVGEVWEDPERDLCALLFNVMGLLHEHLREL